VRGILLRLGAVLIKSGDEMIGSIGVGAPSGTVDEGCAKADVAEAAPSAFDTSAEAEPERIHCGEVRVYQATSRDLVVVM
jgi:hypothetical protein